MGRGGPARQGQRSTRGKGQRLLPGAPGRHWGLCGKWEVTRRKIRKRAAQLAFWTLFLGFRNGQGWLLLSKGVWFSCNAWTCSPLNPSHKATCPARMGTRRQAVHSSGHPAFRKRGKVFLVPYLCCFTVCKSQGCFSKAFYFHHP